MPTVNSSPRKTWRLRKRVAVFVCLTALAIALDQISKALAQVTLADGQRHPLLGSLLGLRLLRNPGASLGLGSDVTWIISLIAILVCLVIIYLLFKTTSMLWTVVLSLIFSGAAGNLIDRVAYAQGFLDGSVVDFLDYGWSVGNIADIYLTVAALAVLILILADVKFTPSSGNGGESKIGGDKSGSSYDNGQGAAL